MAKYEKKLMHQTDMEKWRNKFLIYHPFDNIQTEERQRAKNIIERFKTHHSNLMVLNPEIGIDQFTTDADGNSCNKFILFVGHGFIFDYRLIPAHFEGIEVKSHLCEQMPKEFPPAFPGSQLEAYYSRERYLMYVKKNIEIIRKRLKSENLSVTEALDALTGGWVDHENWIIEQEEKRTMENKEHIEFFNKLLGKTKEAYSLSDVYKNYADKNWGYSVIATSFKKRDKVIVGFNWGAAKNESYGPQKDYPIRNFASQYKDLGSFKRVVNWFNKYFDQIPEVQINYCFFRSEKEEQISEKDLELSGKLFDELIEYLMPSMIISFSQSLCMYLKNTNKLLVYETKPISSNKKIFEVTRGKVIIAKNEIEYFNLPHPNFPITGDARKEAWDFCFKEIK